MDVVASNYDSDANTEDGSCLYPGCTDDNFIEYWNYDPVLSSISTPSIVANLDDGSCLTQFLQAVLMSPPLTLMSCQMSTMAPVLMLLRVVLMTQCSITIH